MNVQFLINAILTLAVLFLLLSVCVLIVRGLMERTNVDTLSVVGLQKSRQVQFQESIIGLLLTLFGLVLLRLWYLKAILTLAVLFLLLGVGVLIVRGLMGRTNVDMLYGVGRQKSRQVQFQESITGLLLTLFGLILLGLWYLLHSNTLAAGSAATPTVEATEAIVSVSITETVPPTAIIATLVTDTPTPSPTALPATEIATATAAPTDTPMLPITPSATPLPVPTRVPTGARINAAYLNLRIEPGGDVLALLKEEDDPLLTVRDGYAKRDGFFWREVEIETGEIGWVAEDYITYYYDEP